jgi:antitoxin CcdA
LDTATLHDEVARARRDRWLENNREALEAYNRHVERGGVFGDGIRTMSRPGAHRRVTR